MLILLAGCNPLVTPSQIKPAPTLTTIPILTNISCEPSSNPFAENPMMSSNEYHAGYYPNITITRVCTLEGEISRGQVYKHQIIPDLIFCLIPRGVMDVPNVGWTIVVSDSLDGSCDSNSDNYVNFAPIVTPPF